MYTVENKTWRRGKKSKFDSQMTPKCEKKEKKYILFFKVKSFNKDQKLFQIWDRKDLNVLNN